MINSKIQQSAFLFAGTAIGAGMLALPIASGASGFPAALVYISFWFIYSIMTMFLILECMGYHPLTEDSGFISMSRQLSGPMSRIGICISYTLLLYAVTSAYIIGGAQLLSNALQLFHLPLSLQLSLFTFSTLFTAIAMQNIKIVGKFNQWLMYFLIASFGGMILFIINNVNLEVLLSSKELIHLIPSTSIIVLSFACHNLLPTILNYLHGEAKDIKQAILLGMCLPLIIYIAWNAVIIGSLPATGTGSILDIQQNHHLHGGELSMLSASLNHAGSIQYQGLLDKMFMIFGLCAIITSYIGVTLSLKDFILQGAKLQQHRAKDILGMIAVYIPSLLFAMFFPYGFSMVLSYAGIIIAYLFGLTPALWVWKARTRLKLTSRYPSGIPNAMLLLLILMSSSIIGLQIYYQTMSSLAPPAKPLHITEQQM